VIVRTGEEVVQEEEEEDGIITDNETDESKAKRNQWRDGPVSSLSSRPTSEMEDELDADSAS
jgi:hypothetical protein